MIGMVLAAGKGQRLQPLTDALPKTLLPLDGERTILDVVLANFAHVGLERAVLVIGFAADRVEELVPELERRHVRPVRAVQRISATNMKEADAHLLGVPAGAAGLSIERISYLGSGRAVEFTRSLYRGDAYDFVAELTIGANCTIGHRAILHGCTIGENSLVGMGATVLNGAKIGRNCLVGANALVTEGKEFPDNSLIVGSPARAVRTLDEKAAEGITASAKAYVQRWRQFAAGLERLD